MSVKTIEQDKSSVTIEYNNSIGDNVVKKRYKSGGFDTGDLPSGGWFELPSSTRPEGFYYSLESGLLKVMSRIPDSERVTPRLYYADDDNLEITMEQIVGLTYRDVLIDALKRGKDPYNSIDYLPRHVAEIHRQLGEQRRDLLTEVKWTNPASSGKVNALRSRSKEEEKKRLWHYLSRIIYYMSPDLEDLRGRVVNKEIETDDVDKQVKAYVRKKLSSRHMFSGSLNDFLDNFVNADRDILYAGLAKVPVIHGDLGPHHLYESGRVIDFDEARLGPSETDLVASLYNVFTYPQDSQQEDHLVDLSLTYLGDDFGTDATGRADKAGLFLAKLVESRLKETLRLFAVDVKASTDTLRSITKEHPKYDGVPDKDLKDVVVYDFFVKGFELFFDYFQRGKGKTRLNKTKYADELYSQIDGIEQLLRVTKVLRGPELSGIRHIDRLLDGE